MKDTALKTPAWLINIDKDSYHYEALWQLNFKLVEDMKMEDSKLQMLQKKFISEKEKLTKNHQNLKKELRGIKSKQEDAELKSTALQKQCIKYTTDVKDSKENKCRLKEAIEELETRKEQLKKARKDHNKNVTEVWKAHVTALAYYKNNLLCHIQLIKQQEATFLFSFFCCNTNENPDYYIKLSRLPDNRWEVLEIKPQLGCQKQLTDHLMETADIQGFLAYVRSLFKELKKQVTV